MQAIKPWAGRAADRARRAVKQRGFLNDEPCVICRQPIDYRLPSTHPDGMSVQHLKPRSSYPHLTWEPSNWAPAHLQCNKAQGTKTIDEIGQTSRNWSMI